MILQLVSELSFSMSSVNCLQDNKSIRPLEQNCFILFPQICGVILILYKKFTWKRDKKKLQFEKIVDLKT